MPLYHFYRLVNNVDDRCYIGMTRRELRKRLWEHRHHSSKCSSKQLVEEYGAENVSIILIHSLEYENVTEARREERRLVEEYRGRCVNLVIPYRSEEEAKEQGKVWRGANKDILRDKNKQWREENEEVLIIKAKARYEANKDTINAQRKAKYEANKDAINAKRREARAKKATTKTEPMVADHES